MDDQSEVPSPDTATLPDSSILEQVLEDAFKFEGVRIVLRLSPEGLRGAAL